MALVKFLKRAYPVCESVLEANLPASDAAFDRASKGAAFSSSRVDLKLPEAMGPRQAVAVVSSGRSLSEVLVAYNRPSWAAGPALAAGFEGFSPRNSPTAAADEKKVRACVASAHVLVLEFAAAAAATAAAAAAFNLFLLFFLLVLVLVLVLLLLLLLLVVVVSVGVAVVLVVVRAFFWAMHYPCALNLRERDCQLNRPTTTLGA